MKKIISLISIIIFSFCLSGCADNKLEDWEYIENKGELIIGITYFQPMNYLDNKGNLTGFETEFAEAVCDILGVKPKFKVIDWNSKETELKAKNIDAVWNGMTYTEARAEEMDFSTLYMKNMPVMVVRKENAEKFKTAGDLKDKTVVSEKGSMGEEVAQKNPFFKNAKYIAVDTQVKGFLEVKSKTADAVVNDYIMAIGSIGKGTDFEDLVISSYAKFDREYYGIGFRKDSPVTVQKINNAITQLIDNGTLKRIADKYNLTELMNI